MVEYILLLLIFASCLYWVAAWWSVRAFFRARRTLPVSANPADRESTDPNPVDRNGRGRRGVPSQKVGGCEDCFPGPREYAPPISVLKPIKGLDADVYRNFRSFCRQDYPHFELLFGVSDADDPAAAVIERLQREFPERAIRLVVAPETGLNPKSSILQELAAQARYDVLAISDSDIRVTPEYLKNVAVPLADRRVGLVTCLYRSIDPASLTARLEGLYLDVGFIPSAVLAGTALGMRFGLGASMVLRKADLLRTGGYAAIGDYLSDDYHVAARITGLGLKVHLSDYVVENVLGETSFRQQWDREVRWARSIRALHPAHYSGWPVTFSTPLAAVFLILGGFSLPLAGALAFSIVLRWVLASRILSYLGQHEVRRSLPWLPVRDCLTALVWCCGLIGRTVTWRGRTFQLLPDGRLQPVTAACGVSAGSLDEPCDRSSDRRSNRRLDNPVRHPPRWLATGEIEDGGTVDGPDRFPAGVSWWRTGSSTLRAAGSWWRTGLSTLRAAGSWWRTGLSTLRAAGSWWWTGLSTLPAVPGSLGRRIRGRGSAMSGPLRRMLVGAVHRLDAVLRRRQGIYEFSDHPQCLLRMSVDRSEHDVELSDGERVTHGDLVADIHLWNERIPAVPDHGRDLAWGRTISRQFLFSLEELARHVEADAQLRDVRAFRAELFLDSRNWNRVTGRLSRYMGFEFVEPPRSPGIWQRCHDLGDSLLRWGLTWAFNVGSLKGKPLWSEKREAWISRDKLLTRFGQSSRQ